MKKVAAFLCMIFFFAACTQNEGSKASENSTKANSSITGAEAFRAAQQFIIDQGYTDIMPTDLQSIKFEKGEFSTDTLKILSYRRNTLLINPLGAKQHGGSWTVGFEYVNQENNIGRAVTIDTLGTNIIMQPEEVRLDWFFEVEPAE